MFFRQLSNNLKRQDWFAVGLELLAVVFGVFLALQAENWNEWRKERIEEKQFLQRLYDGITQSITTTQFAINYMYGHAQMADVVLESLRTCEVSESERMDFANGIYQIGTVVPPNLPEGVFSELRIAGRADMIQSDEITEALGNVITGYNYYMSFHDDIIDRITPHAVYVNERAIFDIAPEVGAKQFIEWDEMSIDMKAVCNDQRFFTAIATVQRHTYEIIKWNELALGRAEQLAGILAAELGLADGGSLDESE